MPPYPLSFVVFSKHGLIQLPGLLIVTLCALKFFRESIERALTFASCCAASPQIHDNAAEVLFLAEFTENHFDLSGNEFKQIDLFVQHLEHVFLDAAGEAEVKNIDLTGLSNAVNAADPLFDRYRVPREVEINDRVAELKIAAFASGFAGEQDL